MCGTDPRRGAVTSPSGENTFELASRFAFSRLATCGSMRLLYAHAVNLPSLCGQVRAVRRARSLTTPELIITLIRLGGRATLALRRCYTSQCSCRLKCFLFSLVCSLLLLLLPDSLRVRISCRARGETHRGRRLALSAALPGSALHLHRATCGLGPVTQLHDQLVLYLV